MFLYSLILLAKVFLKFNMGVDSEMSLKIKVPARD